jgi:hypothetical protein
MLVDRMVALLGARRLVEGRPGLGYLLIECIPVFVWMQITGAMTQDFFYFIAFLSLLGADSMIKEGLVLMTTAGGVAQAVMVLRRPPADPRRTCVRDTLIGRVVWLGTVLWPLALWWAWPADAAPGLRRGVLYGGVLVVVFAASACHGAGGSAFVMWTQAVVPRELRGRFYAWRNFAGYGATALALLVVEVVVPRAHPGDPAQLPWLGGVLLAATAVCIASTWWLARAPTMPAAAAAAIVHAPMVPAVRANRPYLRLLLYTMLNSAAVATSAVFQVHLWFDAGADVTLMARWQGLALYPLMFAGVIAAGAAMPRLHGRWLLIGGHVTLIASEAVLLTLVLHPSALPWMMPLVLGLSGLARGTVSVAWISRLQEIAPPGDIRFPAVFTAAGSVMAMVVALLVMRGLHGMPAGYDQAHLAWTLVAVGVALRLAALVPVAWPDRRPLAT